MPLYEYKCLECDRNFEEIKDYKNRASAFCPRCGSLSDVVPSTFHFKWANPFTKDGEGFTSVNMSKQEAHERAVSNAGKYD